MYISPTCKYIGLSFNQLSKLPPLWTDLLCLRKHNVNITLGIAKCDFPVQKIARMPLSQHLFGCIYFACGNAPARMNFERSALKLDPSATYASIGPNDQPREVKQQQALLVLGSKSWAQNRLVLTRQV